MKMKILRKAIPKIKKIKNKAGTKTRISRKRNPLKLGGSSVSRLRHRKDFMKGI